MLQGGRSCLNGHIRTSLYSCRHHTYLYQSWSTRGSRETARSHTLRAWLTKRCRISISAYCSRQQQQETTSGGSKHGCSCGDRVVDSDALSACMRHKRCRQQMPENGASCAAQPRPTKWRCLQIGLVPRHRMLMCPRIDCSTQNWLNEPGLLEEGRPTVARQALSSLVGLWYP